MSGQDLTRWTNAAKWTVAWTQDMEGDPLLQRRWLPCVLATASAVTDATLKQSLEDRAVGWMVAGSILGAALGGLLLGMVPADWLMGLLGVVLLISAIKTFQHAH